MKAEEFEVWFESIEKEIKTLSDKINNLGTDNTSQFQQVFDDFINKIKGVRLAISKETFEQIDNKLNSIASKINDLQQPTSLDPVKKAHYFFFFPDLKEWLSILSRARLIWFILILLFTSLFINGYLGRDYFRYKLSDQKLKYILYNGDDNIIEVMDTVEARFASPDREKIISVIKKRDQSKVDQYQKLQRILSLEKELEELKSK